MAETLEKLPRVIWCQKLRQDAQGEDCKHIVHHLLLQEVAFSLALGEISEPFESPEGFHMLMRIA